MCSALAGILDCVLFSSEATEVLESVECEESTIEVWHSICSAVGEVCSDTWTDDAWQEQAAVDAKAR